LGWSGAASRASGRRSCIGNHIFDRHVSYARESIDRCSSLRTGRFAALLSAVAAPWRVLTPAQAMETVVSEIDR
jgi:hypothetical protein